MALLKFIIIFYAIYFIVKLLFRNFIKKITSNPIFDNNETNDQNYTNETNVKPEGHVTIHTSEKKDKLLDSSIGEYVDYEELKK